MVFTLEKLQSPLVSPSYFSSYDLYDPMEVDMASMARSDNSDVQEIACYREQPLFNKNTIAGRRMTTDATLCTDEDKSSLWLDEVFIDQFMQVD